MNGRREEAIHVEQELSRLVDRYPPLLRAYYNSIATKSYTTKNNYIRKIIIFWEFMRERCGEEEFTNEQMTGTDVEDIDAYLLYITKEKNPEKDYAKSYLMNQTSALNSFFNFLVRKRHIEENPLVLADNKPTAPSGDNKEIVYLTDEEKEIVFNNIKKGVGTSRSKAKQEKYKNRDMLIFMLPLVTGIRVSALVHINLEDIDFQRQILTIYDKGIDRDGRPQEKFLPDEAMVYINRWVKDRSDLPSVEDTDALLVSLYGGQVKRLTTKAVQKIVAKYTANIDKAISPHKLRSTFGTDYYRMTQDVYATAAAMGHKRVETTQHYAAIDKDAQKRNVDTLAQRNAALT